PMSDLCARLTPKPRSTPSWKAGVTATKFRRMRAAALVGIIADEALARLQVGGRIAREHCLHRLLISGEMILQAAADDDDAAFGIGQAGGAVLRFPQDRGIAAVVERIFHGGGGLA